MAAHAIMQRHGIDIIDLFHIPWSLKWFSYDTVREMKERGARTERGNGDTEKVSARLSIVSRSFFLAYFIPLPTFYPYRHITTLSRPSAGPSRITSFTIGAACCRNSGLESQHDHDHSVPP